ncbi:amino acid adenylation domain-containing protein [Streptomyces sp. NPDC094447]|uniref:amino acid adenylation domain-containing protein n=1 Tax=Streptomyces sp. NPDC094447 TaxID=3366062 RepID=UPI00380A4DD6
MNNLTPPTGPLVDRFVTAALASPGHTAVVAPDASLTYRQLLAAAVDTALRLRESGASADAPVGLIAHRGAGFVAGALAAMIAGTGFVPLDPAHPPKRLAELMRRAGVTVLIAPEGGAGTVAATDGPAVRVVVPDLAVAEVPAGLDDLAAGWTADALAYQMFTSGSSGEPKLVAIEQRSVCALLDGFDAVAPAPAPLVSSSVCSFSFDVAVWEVFGAITAGGTLHILDAGAAADPAQLAALLTERGVTSAYLPPFGLELFADELGRTAGSALRRVLVGVEPITQGTLRRLVERRPGLTVVNGYGPTEATVCSTLYVFTGAADPERRVPIGTAVPGWDVVIADDSLAALPDGELGEIIIGGAGLARGYVGSPELTAERFVTGSDGRRWYRTGDLGRRLPSGDVEFVGRRDNQVKIRGFRIELGEVELALRGCAGVRNAIVVAVPVGDGRRLSAFVEGDADADAVRAELARTLPEYMVPARVTVLGSLPVTPNGKPDRPALLALERRRPVAGPAVPAADALEEQLAAVWCELLGLDEVGRHDDFFELGGDSRTALLLASRILKSHGGQTRPTALLGCRTIAESAALLRSAAAATGTRPDPAVSENPASTPRPAPLSFGQEGLWFRQAAAPEDTSFVLPVAFEVTGETSTDRLASTVTEVLTRYQAFALRVSAVDGVPCQIVAPGPARVDADTVPVPVASVGAELRRRHEQAARNIAGLPERLWQAQVFAVEGGAHAVLLSVHHLLIDGTSVPLIARDLAAALGGEESPSRGGPLELAATQRAEAAAGDWAVERAHWRRTLEAVPDALELPLDRGRPAHREGTGLLLEHTLSGEAAASVTSLATRFRTSPFAVVMTALGVLAGRYSGQDAFAVTTPAAVDRACAGDEDMVGYLVNLLPVVFELGDEASFAAVLRDTDRRLAEALAHGALPFEELVAEMGPNRAANAQRLTRLVVVQEVPSGLPRKAGDHLIDSLPVAPGTAKYELTVHVAPTAVGHRLAWEFATDLFEEETIRSWQESVERILVQAGRAPDAAVGGIDLLTDRDRAVIAVASGTPADHPGHASVTDLFDEMVVARPDAVAVEHGSTRLDYATLHAWETSIARRLLAAGAGPEEPVLVLTHRGPEFAAAVLGVLRAGCSYVPVDVLSPPDRIRAIMEAAGGGYAVASEDLRPLLPADVRVLLPGDPPDPSDPADRFGPSDQAGPFAPSDQVAPSGPFPVRTPDSRTYLMFTSGSTGTPKGVEVVDRGVVRLARGRSFARFGADDAFVLASNLAFDAATLEIWGALLNGGRLVIPDETAVRDPRELAALIHRSGVTAGFFNVSVFRLMIEADAPALAGMHTILVGGEAVPSELLVRASRSLDWRTFVNGYGPTENTTFSCCHRLTEPPEAGRGVPVGRPLSGSTALVVDENLAPVPVGCAGEIVVGGDGLARGYLGLPELTSERFVVGPDGRRWYRTGDMGRLLRSGLIEFVGRRDDQVKIRGFRIELSEVESALSACSGVDQALALAPETDGARRLIGFVTGTADATQVRRELAERVPSYLVPARIITVTDFPLTANGKADRRALAALVRERPEAEPLVRPRGAVQSRIAALWGEVLHVTEVGVHDNFFDLGGDSRMVPLLVERLRQEFSRELRVVDLMSRPTVAQLSRFLTGDARDSGSAATSTSKNENNPLQEAVRTRMASRRRARR